MASRVYTIDRHQDKAEAYIAALRAAGYARVNSAEHAAFHLCHLDFGGKLNRRSIAIDEAERRGQPVFSYPHHARPTIEWDGVRKPRKHAACFVQAPGHAKVMQHFYPNPIEVIGWSYSPVQEFTPRGIPHQPLKVLFAPIHPFGNGKQGWHAKKINKLAYARLLKLHMQGEITLSIRHNHPLAANGLQEPPRMPTTIRAYQVSRTLDWKDLQRYDVVVGHQTIAYMAVAVGVPTVMMGEEWLPDVVLGWLKPHEEHLRPRHWDEYAAQVMYPLDIANAGDAGKLLRSAASHESEAVQAWKANFIGQPFSPANFVKRLESYL